MRSTSSLRPYHGGGDRRTDHRSRGDRLALHRRSQAARAAQRPALAAPGLARLWSMALTIGLIALVGRRLDLPLGAAVLLGAVLAPTDPVLASDVQVATAGPRPAALRPHRRGRAQRRDGVPVCHARSRAARAARDRARAAGAGSPSTSLGGPGGLLVGALLGTVGWPSNPLPATRAQGSGRSRRLPRPRTDRPLLRSGASAPRLRFPGGVRGGPRAAQDRSVVGRPGKRAGRGRGAGRGRRTRRRGRDHPETAPAYMAQAVLGFTEQLERIGEVAVMLLVAVMISVTAIPGDALWFVPLLLLVIRPVAAALGMIGSTRQGCSGHSSPGSASGGSVRSITSCTRSPTGFPGACRVAHGTDACGCRHLGGRSRDFGDAVHASLQRSATTVVDTAVGNMKVL